MLLAVPRVTVAGGVGFSLAYERAVFGAPVPAHAFLVVDMRRDVQPYDDVARTMRLRSRLGVEHRRRGAHVRDKTVVLGLTERLKEVGRIQAKNASFAERARQ